VLDNLPDDFLKLDSWLEFDAVRADADFFPALPARPAVCLIEPREENAQPFLLRTQNLRRRLQRLLGPIDAESKRLNLSDFALGVRYRVTASALEQTFTYYQHAKRIFPKRYTSMMKLRPPAVLKVSLRNAYPRCYVTRRIVVDHAGVPAAGAYYGPFASRRSALAFAERAMDFFKVRRCQIKIKRDPSFPGCIYSEMKMCLAPCFAGCTKEEYDSEVQQLVQFLDSGGGSLRTMLEEEREHASENLDFERAAALHKRLEKLDDALRGQSEMARRIQDLNAVILQRTAEDQTIGVYVVRGGRLAAPLFVRFAELAGQPRSAEQIFREHLESPTQLGTGSADLSEHLSLVARWYYSTPREGEIFFRDRDWPYRKILRACSRLLTSKTFEAQSPESAGPTKSDQGA
jgi:excinuclease UvrABC nuclease subunit